MQYIDKDGNTAELIRVVKNGLQEITHFTMNGDKHIHQCEHGEFIKRFNSIPKEKVKYENS